MNDFVFCVKSEHWKGKQDSKGPLGHNQYFDSSTCLMKNKDRF